MRIKYIQQINAFNDSLFTKTLSTGQIALWYALMHINNKCTWIEWFTASNKTLELLTGLSRGGIEKARNTLKQLDYIDFKSNGKRATSYKIINLSSDSTQDSIQGKSSGVYKAEAEEKQDGIQDSRTLNRLEETRLDNKDIVEIVDYLNEQLGTKYKATTKATKSHINARLTEGNSVEDFKKVIDTKKAQWFGNEKMERFLRPETLFGTKFENYLNESNMEKPKSEVGEFNIGTTL